MELENMVMNNVIEKTKVYICPVCGRESFTKEGRNFIRDFGECAQCEGQAPSEEDAALLALLADF